MENHYSKKKKRNTFTLLLIALIWLVVITAITLIGMLMWLKARMGTAFDFDSIPEVSLEDVIREELGTSSIEELLSDETEEVQEAVKSADEALDANAEIGQLELEGRVTNYLLIGSDRRGSGGYGNSDTLMILSVNTNTGKIHLTSLMRAMYVSIPNKSGNGYWNGMLNWAYSAGGPERCVATVEHNFKIDIKNYFVVDFKAFEKVIDCLGGVTIELTRSEASAVLKWSGEPIASGVQKLDGAQALAYCRDRHDNDFNRTRRQRNMISAVLTQLKGSDLATLTELADTILPYITTDMDIAEILAELVNVPGYLTYEVDQRMLPVENEDGGHYVGITYIDGHEMYMVDWGKNLAALEDFLTH